MNLQRLYMDLPPGIRKLLGKIFRYTPRKYLYGRHFLERRSFLDEAQYWSEEQIENYQRDNLRSILIHAYETTRFYKRIFDERNFNPYTFDSYTDLQILPFIDKDIIRKNITDLISTTVPSSSRSYVTTGGTSGKPLGFYIDKQRSVIEWAHLTNMWTRIGFTQQSRRAVFRGEPVKTRNNILWFEDPLLNQISFSTFHMTDDNLTRYIKVMNSYMPDFLHGYPSALMTLGQFVRRYNPPILFKLIGMIAISENVYQHQREFLEETFQARFFSFYGHSEKLILAGECEHTTDLHLDPFYGYTEIINQDGLPISKDGERGELVGTGFINHAMPFIRYRTGDVCIVRDTHTRCRCGRNYRLIKNVEGRWIQEMFVTKNHSYISITALNVHSDIFDNVARFQFEQSEPGKAILNIIPSEKYSEADDKKILSTLDKKVDSQIDFVIRKVSQLESTSSGKFIFVKQLLDIGDFFSAR